MVKIDLEEKYLQPVKKAIENNNNPYTQVVNVKPTKAFQPTVNDYNQQPINQVTENLRPLINLQQVGENTWQQVKQLGRLAWNLPSAFEVAKPDIKMNQAINQQAQSQVAPMGTGYNSQNYLSLKDSMEQKYDYALMPENTKKAYENVVDTIFRNEISGKPLIEQKAIIEELYKDKEMPEFVAKKYNTVLSQETEANLRLENAKQNLVAMVNKNVDEMNLIQKKYEGDDSLLTDFTSEVLGTVVKMTPYIAASMIAGPGGFGTVATGYMAGSTVMGTQVFTESLAQALSEGATEQQATQYAMVSALIEAGTEAISGGIPGAPKGLLSSGVQGLITDSFKDKAISQATQVLMEKAVDVFGEGAEEALAEYLGSMALAIYREDERTDEELTADMVKSFVMGMVTSGAMQMGEYYTIKIVEPLVTEKTLDVQSLPQEQVNEVLNKIALRTGVQVTDGQAYVLKDLPRGQKGYIEDNQIVLNQKDVEENGLLLSALPHEMTHALENTKGYRELANFVLSQQSKSLGMSLEELKQAYQEEYQRQFDEGLTAELRIANDEEIARELVANFIRTNIATRPLKDANGDVITDDNGNIVTYRDYNALVKLSERPKALDSIKKVLRTMVARSKGTQAEEYFTELDSFIQKALVSKQSKASNDDIQFSILNDLESKNLSTMSLNGSKIARESGLTGKEQLLDYSLQKGLGYTQVDDVTQPKYMVETKSNHYLKMTKDDLWEEHRRVLAEENEATKGKGFFSKEAQEIRKPYAEEMARISLAMSGKNYDELFNSYDEYLNYRVEQDELAKQEYDIKEQQRRQKELDRINNLVKMNKEDILMSDEEIEQFIEDNEIGTTNDINNAIFIFGNGTMVNGDFNMGIRGADHQMLSNIFEYTTKYPKIEGLSVWGNIHLQTGIVRIVPEENVALIMQGQELTQEQRDILEQSNYKVEEYLPLVKGKIKVDRRDSSIKFMLDSIKKDDVNLNELKNIKVKTNNYTGKTLRLESNLNELKQSYDTYNELYESNGIEAYRNDVYGFMDYIDNNFDDLTESGINSIYNEFKADSMKELEEDYNKYRETQNTLYEAQNESNRIDELISLLPNPLNTSRSSKSESVYLTYDTKDYDRVVNKLNVEIMTPKEELGDTFEVRISSHKSGRYFDAESNQMIDYNSGDVFVNLNNNKAIDTSVLSVLNINDLTSDNKQEFWNKVEEVKQNITLTPEQVEPFNRYLTYLSNYVRDYSNLRRDNSGHLTTDQQEKDFNVRDEQGRLKVFYVQENGISDKALNYGYFLLNSPLGLDLNQTKEVYLKANLLDANGTELQSLNFDSFDLSEMTNSEVIKALGNQNSIESVYKAIQEQFDVNGLDYGDSVMVFNPDQYKSINPLTDELLYNVEEKETLIKNTKQIVFAKVGDKTSIKLYSKFDDLIYSRVTDNDNVINTFGSELANTILSNATETEQSFVLKENILSTPSDKVEQGGFSSFRDDNDNQLTKEQVEYFKDTKVRHTDGTLLVAYHGTSNIFDEFSYQTMGKNGLARGVGFYFTNEKTFAQKFTDKNGIVVEAYLNITKPIQSGMKNIDKETLKQIIIELHNSHEEDLGFLTEFGDVDRYGVDRIATSVARTYLDRNEDDINLIGLLINDAGIDYETVLRVVNKYTQYDGIISGAVDGVVFIPFFPEQIKSINNPNPTQSRNIKFMIDFKPDTNSVLITKQPTQSEYNEMAQFFDKTLARQGNDIFVQIESPDGRYFDKRYSVSMPSGMIVNEIKKFFDTSKREEFFKESSIRDDNGNIINLFHGTRDTFNEFKESISGEFGKGIYLTDNENTAQWYAENVSKGEGEQRVINVYANIKNPFTVTKQEWIKMTQRSTPNTVRDRLIKQGYDGIIGIGINGVDKQYVAFYPNQIKEVTNLNPTSSNDIRYMIEESEKVRQFAQSTLQGNIGKIASQKVEDDILSGKFNYQVMADKPTLEQANSTINSKGVDASYQEFIALFNSGKRMTKLDVTKGEILIVKLANEGKIREFEEVLAAVAAIGTESGQNIQAMHMIKGLSIQGQVATLERVVERMKTKHFEDTGKRLVSKDNKEIEIPQDYKEFFTQAQMKEIQLKEQQKEFQNNQLELERLQNEIDSYSDSIFNNDDLKSQLNELRDLQRQEDALNLQLLRLQKKMDTYSNENITFLKADVERAKNSLNEVESKLKEVRNAQKKFDKLSKELSESTVNIEEVKALNEQVKQVRKAQRLLDKMIAENQAYTSQENINAIMDEVKGKIAEQMPVSTMDKLNAWRYLAMLGNPRTHIRNMVGNSAMMPIVASKNLIAAGLQHFIPSEQRTTVLSASKEAKEYAKMDYLEFGKDLMSKGKYSIKGEIREKQRTFKWNWLENTSNFVFDALSAEDLFFKQHYYKSSLARYITAQKLDVNTITEEQITQARIHAIEEANKATFNDASALASALTRIEQNQKSAGNKVASFAMQSLIPFKKTPLNILKRGVEYSPIGLGQNLLFNLNKVKNGQMTSTQFIDGISAGLTGTGIALVGAWLYSIGVLELGGDDDETKRLSYLENALGRQRYSLKFFDQSLTIDWLAPSVMPLMVGAELQKSLLDESGESLFDRFTESLIGIMNPLFDLTMLQGVTDVLQSYSSGGAETAVDVASTMFANYINQYIPTLSGQIAQMKDSTQRSTYAPKDSPSAWLETVGRRILNKIPYASFLNAPVVNVKGEPITNAENLFIRAFNVFLNPGYLKDRTETIYDAEILRLYDVTMDSGVLPRIAPKSFKLDGEEQILDNQEYATFQQTLGQTSYDLLKEYTQTRVYESLDDTDRVKFIEDLYEYSYQKARAEYLEKYGKENTDSGYQKIVQSELKGLEIKDYLVIKSIYDKIKDEGGEVKENFLRTIQSKGYSTNQINTFIETSTTWKIESSEPKLKTSGLKKLK